MKSPPSNDSPTFPDGPPGWPVSDPLIELSLQQAYADGSWGRYSGTHTEKLASLLSEQFRQTHVTLCCSGTLAVELALQGLKIGEGDEVILAGYDFPGNFRAIEAVGAKPVLVDLRENGWSLDPQQVRAAFETKTDSNVKAIIASHLHGDMADMKSLRAIADENDCKLIEDCCQTPGANVQGKTAGCWGDVAVMSFGGSKLLTAGRGGAVLCDDDRVHQRMTIFRERGNDAFALSELQAAVLPPQLEQLAARNQLRQQRVDQLLAACNSAPCLELLSQAVACEPAYYKLAFQLKDIPLKDNGISREQFVATMHQEGIAIDAGFRGFVKRPTTRCRKIGDLPNSRIASERTLLLHHPILLEDEETIEKLANAINAVE